MGDKSHEKTNHPDFSGVPDIAHPHTRFVVLSGFLFTDPGSPAAGLYCKKYFATDTFHAGASGSKDQSQKNQVVFDLAHTNRFSMSEIEALTNALIVKGAEIESIANAKDLQIHFAWPMPGNYCSTDEFSNEDVQSIMTLPIAWQIIVHSRPTRTYQDYYFDLEDSVQIANHVLEPYGLAFQTDYVYSISHNEGNFRNVYASPSGESELTRNVKQVVFYGTHSISGQMTALLAGDQTTLSSSTD